MTKSVNLYLASGVSEGVGFWVVSFTEEDNIFNSLSSKLLECYRKQNLRRALQLNDQAPWLTNLVSRGGILKKNAADLLNAVTYLMYQGGHKGPEIKENVELICKNTDKEIKEMVGDMITSQQSKNTH